MARDRRAVGARHARRVGTEALGAKRREIFVVRIEDVLATDVPGRVEECDADARGDVEQASPLPNGLRAETVEERRHLGRGGKTACIRAQIGEPAFICRKCARVAENADSLCKPVPLKKGKG